MINDWSDSEVLKSEEDVLDLQENVDYFLKRYIHSEFSGSILLNGKWGIGKTSYLNLIQANSNTSCTKYVRINFWEDNWFDKPFNLALRRSCPVLWWSINLSTVIISMLIVVSTSLVTIFSRGATTFSDLNLLSWLLVLFASGFGSFLLSASTRESLYEFFFNRYYASVTKKKKLITICDDFDRLDFKTQTQLHSFLLKLRKKNGVLIIVGEYEKLISNVDDSLFLQKIISYVETMPMATEPSKIWEILIEKIFDAGDGSFTLSDGDKNLIRVTNDLFCHERRLFREGIQLFNLFRRKYFMGNIREVNFGEQLLICYIYQFHLNVYYWIVNNKPKIYNEKVIPHKDFQMLGNKDYVALDELIEKQLKIKIGRVLSESIYALFNSDRGYKFQFPTIKKSYYFSLYQIENISNPQTLNVLKVEEIVFQKEDNLQALKFISDQEMMNQFYDLFIENFLWREKPTDTKIIEMYLRLLKNLILLVLHNENESRYNGSTKIYTHMESLFYKLKEYIIYSLKISPEEIFYQTLFKLDSLQLSEMLFLVPRFVPARDSLSTKKQNEIFQNVFMKYENFELMDEKYPSFCLFAYKDCRESLESKFDKQFNVILNIEDDSFFDFLINKLASTITGYNALNKKSIEDKALNMDRYFISKEFEVSLLKRIENLPIEKKQIIDTAIDKGKEW